jgi:hypothetical protein
MGEIVGAVIGQDWYVMAPLDTESHKPAGAVYAFDATSGRWAKKKPMPEPAHHEARAVMGITDGMVRLSVGLEDVADLIGDLKRALAV